MVLKKSLSEYIFRSDFTFSISWFCADLQSKYKNAMNDCAFLLHFIASCEIKKHCSDCNAIYSFTFKMTAGTDQQIPSFFIFLQSVLGLIPRYCAVFFLLPPNLSSAVRIMVASSSSFDTGIFIAASGPVMTSSSP